MSLECPGYVRILAASVLGLAACSAHAQFAATCTSASTQPVGSGTHAFDLRTIGAPNSTATPSCAELPSSYENFLAYVPTASGTAFIRFGPLSNGLATVAVLGAGCDFPGFSSECRNSNDPCTPDGLIKLPVEAGTPVILQVAGQELDQPFGTLVITENPASPPGDTCQTALPAALGANTFSIADAVDTPRPDGNCAGYVGKWFVFVPSASGGVEASLCGGIATGGSIALYSDCDTILDSGNVNDDNITYPPCRTKARVTAGQPVYINVSQVCYSTAQFTLSFLPGVLPSNDTCETAANVSVGTTVLDNRFAATELALNPCDGFFPSGKDLWFRFTPPANAAYDIYVGYDVTGLSVPIQYVGLALFPSCDELFPLACESAGFSYASFRIDLNTESTYLIRVAGAGRPQDCTAISSGQVNLVIRQSIPPSNDACANARVITAGEHDFDLRDGTPDGARACAGEPPIPDLWFQYTPSFTGRAEVSLAPDVDYPQTRQSNAEITLLSTCGGVINRVGALDYDTLGNGVARLAFDATAGQTVLVRVAANWPIPYISAARLYAGPIRATIPPLNDVCEEAPLISTSGVHPFALVGATRSHNCNSPVDCQGDACTTAIASDVFFRFVATRTGVTKVSVDDGEPYFDGSVYRAGAVLAILSACNTQPTACALQCGDFPLDQLNVNTVAGQTYILRIGSYVGAPYESLGGTIRFSCPADFNGSGAVTIQDIFDFLSAYFLGSAAADFNGSSDVTVQDIFDYLAAYFVGC